MIRIFTGIIEEIGEIGKVHQASNKYRLEINCNKVLENTMVGDSIATNGVCLTVVMKGENYFMADVMKESIRRSNLQYLESGCKVNLERALTLNKPLGGHIVTGHVDNIGEIVKKKREGNSVWFTIKTDTLFEKYLVNKGSVALDGISLTIAETESNYFKVSIIPHTEHETTLLKKEVGDLLNIEYDIIGKYIYKYLNLESKKSNEKSRIDMNFLGKHGFI